ncbi:MAG: hypothetical protein IJW83_00125 [Clostridia bacterium]|nr:hypothetical protein [Clostridia bacterium]
MILQLQLTNKSLVAVPYSAIILPIAEAKITFFSAQYRLGQLIASVNGTPVALKNDRTLDLSPFLKVGVLEIAVTLVVNGKETMKWTLEPINVRLNETNYEAIPELVSLRRDLDSLREDVVTLKKAVLEIVELIKKGESVI